MMLFRLLVGTAFVAIASALAACAPTPPPANAVEIDDRYGIPAGSVPSEMLKPNGTMNNGLLPAQPYDTGG